MKINLFDDNAWKSLRPLTFTRPVADLRIGILTISEKWEKHLGAESGWITEPHLQPKFPRLHENDLLINGSFCPDAMLLEAINNLQPGQMLKMDDIVVAVKPEDRACTELDFQKYRAVQYPVSSIRLVYPEDVFKHNDVELRKDFTLLTQGRKSAPISSTNTLIGDDFFAEEGASAECATFNSLKGPIYLGKHTQVWEGSHIRGSFALCDHSDVKMGAKIYGQTTVGPYSRVGGEINNAVIWGYSSKGHEGYLGNSVVGQWCNIGAGTNNSNLKNNYAEVRLWDYEAENFRKTGLQFCGLIMADHAKCAISTQFNTGTVAGISANIFGAGFPRNFIPDFAWGGAHGFDVYALKKFFETAEKVFERRSMVFDQQEKDLLTAVFELTQPYRRF